jgi:GNAT superfamily N-acetyltransferase
MPADLRIDAATSGDVTTLLGLIKALADYEHLSSAVVATEASLRAALFGDPPRAEAVLAHVGGTAVGYAVYFHTYSTFLGRTGMYLEDVFVLPEWRRKGIGRRLLRHVAELAVARGCGRLEWSVLDWNEPAIRFYQSLGARPLDEWTVYRLTGDALTRLAVDPAGAA